MACKVIRKYRKAWELEPAFSGWLSSLVGDDTKAFCKLCRCSLQAHKKDILKHSLCKKHLEALKHKKENESSKKMTDFISDVISDKRKVAELKLAAFISEHCSILAANHLAHLIKNLDESSQVLQDVKLQRSKCTALIKNVISPCIFKDLIDDIGESNYSLIIDESTSVDNSKMLCIVVRYFSQAKQSIETSFLKLLEVEAGDAFIDFGNNFKANPLRKWSQIRKIIWYWC